MPRCRAPGRGAHRTGSEPHASGLRFAHLERQASGLRTIAPLIPTARAGRPLRRRGARPLLRRTRDPALLLRHPGRPPDVPYQRWLACKSLRVWPRLRAGKREPASRPARESLLACQLRRDASVVAVARVAAGRSLPGMSLAFALIGSIQRFHRLLRQAVARALTTTPSLAGVSRAAEGFSRLMGDGASRLTGSERPPGGAGGLSPVGSLSG